MHGILNGEQASAVCCGGPCMQGRGVVVVVQVGGGGGIITLCWAAGRENNAER